MCIRDRSSVTNHRQLPSVCAALAHSNCVFGPPSRLDLGFGFDLGLGLGCALGFGLALGNSLGNSLGHRCGWASRDACAPRRADARVDCGRELLERQAPQLRFVRAVLLFRQLGKGDLSELLRTIVPR